MASQQHLNCERESHSLLPEKCPPHILLVGLKFFVCHEYALLQELIEPSLPTISVSYLRDVQEKGIANHLQAYRSRRPRRVSAIHEEIDAFPSP
jgi:hypothetical protein